MFDLPPSTRVPAELAHLPRVAYVFQIHSHQRPTGLDEGILYGDPMRRMLPTIVHPNEVLDGAVLRGFMGRSVDDVGHAEPSDDPGALRGARPHASGLPGVVVTVAQATEPERVRSAFLAAGLVAHVLGADGAVFTKIGGGAPHVDMAQAAAQCEALGVKTTRSSRTCRPTAARRACCSSTSRAWTRSSTWAARRTPLTLPADGSRASAPTIWSPSSWREMRATYGTLCGAIEQIGVTKVMAEVR